MTQANKPRSPPKREFVAALVLAVLLAPAPPVRAQVALYHSAADDGVDSGPAQISGVTTLHLWFDAGSTPSAPGQECTGSGAGDEVCQWATTFQASGGVVIQSLSWAPFSGFALSAGTTPGSGPIHATGGDAVGGQLGPTKLADVVVSGTSGGLEARTPGAFGFVNSLLQLEEAQPAATVLAVAEFLGWSQTSSGVNFSCGLTTDGAVHCWGDNSLGQLAVPAGSYKQISAGDAHACAIRSNDTIACWGDDSFGQVSGVAAGTFLEISLGLGHSCGLRSDETVTCWGLDTSGQATPPGGSFREIFGGADHHCGLRGNSTAECWGDDSDGEASPPAGTFLQLSAGSDYTCGVRPDGGVQCWGDPAFTVTFPPPAVVFQEISAGDTHTCGIESDGDLNCWGTNASGESSPPSGSFTQVGSGTAHGCAVRSDSSLVCWGDDALGESSPPLVLYPEVTAGGDHTCALGSDGRVSCWGDDSFGQSSPTFPAESYDRVSTSQATGAGAYSASHTCAIRSSDGSLDCWGTDVDGQADPPLGSFTAISAGFLHTCGIPIGAPLDCWGEPDGGKTAAPIGSFVDVGAGAEHSCGLRTDGAVVCWGSNSDGQSSPPAAGFDSISAAGFHNCGVDTDGLAACWGKNDVGQSSAPPGLFGQVAAGGGGSHSCGVRASGSVSCWGANGSGQSTPPAGSFVSVSAGQSHTCGVLGSGGLVCWGANAAGQATPPGDTDADGFADASDNCPLVANATQLDGDGDGAGDACDNCNGIPNGDQRDVDGDAVGDLCDNCRTVANPGQADTGGIPGVGDGCEPFIFAIKPGAGGGGMGPLASGGPSAMAVDPNDPSFELFLLCGAESASLAGFAVILPTGFSDFELANFGATVAAGSVVQLGPGLTDPNTRSDTLYVQVAGAASNGGLLCSPGGVADLATLQVAGLPDPAPTPVYTTEGLAQLSFDLVLDAASQPVPREEVEFVVTSDNPEVRLQIGPALADASGTRYEILLASDLLIHRATFGITGFEGLTPAQVEFGGCLVPAGSNERRSCAGQGTLGPTVAFGHANTFTIGPSSVFQPDTIYVSLVGNINQGPFGLQPSLNVADAGQSFKLGEILFTGTGPAPIPVLTVDQLSAAMGDPNALAQLFTLSDGGFVGLAGSALGVVQNAPDDFDGDNAQDETDNCPFTANPLQFDTGGLGTVADPNLALIADGIGDSCQCGESSSDGLVTQADVAKIRRSIAGKETPTAAEMKRCSVKGGTECDMSDVAVLIRARSEQGPGLAPVCTSAIPESDPLDP